MTLMTGTHAMLFGAISFIRAHYQRDTPDAYTGQSFPQADLGVTKPDMAPFVVTDATLRRFRFGIGVTVPIIDGATWELQYGGQPSSTRYHATNARLAQFMIEPAAAVQITRWLSIGLGIDVIGTWVTNTFMTDMGAKVDQMACAMAGSPPDRCPLGAPLARENPAFDARTEVDGVGWNAGVYGGLLVTPLPSLRFGFTIHSGSIEARVPVTMKVDIPAAAKEWMSKNLPAVKLPELEAQGEVKVASPMIIKAGAAYLPIPRLELATDFLWIQKSKMGVMLGNVQRSTSAMIASQVLIKGCDDEMIWGLRGAYQLLASLRLGLRFEYANNTRPERFTTPVSLDVAKFSLHVGAAWQVHRHVALYLEYSHYFLIPRTVRQTNFKPNALPTTPEEEGFDRPSATGNYWAETDRLGGGLTLHF